MNEKRLNQLLEQRGYDAIVATTLPNVFYSTGFYSLGQKFISATKVFSVVVPGATPKVGLVLPVGESDMAVEEMRAGVEMWPYGQFFVYNADSGRPGTDGEFARALNGDKYAGHMEALAAALKGFHLENCRIAVDELGLTPAEWERLPGMIPARIETGNSLWKEIRMVKTPQEVENLRMAARITSAAIDHSLANLREGMTENELALVYERYLLEQGAAPAVSVVLFGDHSAYPNGVHGERRLKRGDLIRFDSGCVFNNYYADLARNAVYGDPGPAATDKIRKYYDAMLQGARDAIAAMKPGVTGGRLFDIAVESVIRAGVPGFKRTHCGHGIGAELYDQPVLREGVGTKLEAGMVFCVETPYYELGLGGIQVEDTVVVTPDGVEYLSPPTGPLEML
ncbi:MAG: M24 family metallopeptidase [Ignavibacteriales bacterium]